MDKPQLWRCSRGKGEHILGAQGKVGIPDSWLMFRPCYLLEGSSGFSVLWDDVCSVKTISKHLKLAPFSCGWERWHPGTIQGWELLLENEFTNSLLGDRNPYLSLICNITIDCASIYSCKNAKIDVADLQGFMNFQVLSGLAHGSYGWTRELLKLKYGQ